MISLILRATADLARYLSAKLPELSPDWWQKHVLDRLSFQQQRVAQERRFTTLQQFDFAALMRILDQNWYELSRDIAHGREARTWIKELQTVRNKWAHLSAETLPPSEIYRDADTLGRLLTVLEAAPETLTAIESAKALALSQMSGVTPAMDRPVESAEIPTAPPEAAPPVTPLQTTRFKAGDLVALRSAPATLLPIMEVVLGGAECRYRVFQNNAIATYYESQLQPVAQSGDERAAILLRELHAHLTSLKILSPSTANLFSLRSGRVKFVPYQYRPVLKLIRSDRPRLLIADEVGVGKTVEAGLIIKELKARMDLSSVLVICPKALVAERKWFNEMKRFDEQFTALDGPLLRHCLQETHLEGEWPEQYAKAIVPFSLFDSNLVLGSGTGKMKDKGLNALNPPPKFDLVIVDEAHHIRNSETYLHQGVRFFCDNAQAVLLLTATPVQLGSGDLYTLLNVLRPDLVIDPASFTQMAEPNQHINDAVQYCRKGGGNWQKEARDRLSEISQTEWGRLFLCESPSFQRIYDRLQDDALTDADRIELVGAIEELYTFSSMINRTRRRDIGVFTTRKPETLTIEFTPQQKRMHDGVLNVVAKILARCHGDQNVMFMMTTIRRQAASCLYGLAPFLSGILGRNYDRLEFMELSDSDEETDFSFVDGIRSDIESLVAQARSLDAEDPKAAAFLQVLQEKNQRPNNKVLVFSTFRHTLAYLNAKVRNTQVRVGLIHGDIADDERADLRRRFALPKDDEQAIDVLLSSEVGCEGLDFQFCDMLVNYDLPWNPMRIEQRIGRIDRYGQQSETVAIINMVTPGTVDADIYERCLWRIGVFQHAVGGSEEILGQITQELHDIADSFNLSPEERNQRLQQLSDNGIRQIQEEQTLEAKQSELFGLNVPNQAWRDEIRAAENFWLSPAALQACVSTYLADRLASDTEFMLGDKPCKTLRLSQEARTALLADYRKLPRSVEPVAREWEKWLKGSQPMLTISFDQEAAAENPKVTHLSVVHPLVRQAARYLEITEPKYFTLAVASADLPTGNHHFALYRWAKHGFKQDEALVAVADDPQIESAVLELLQTNRSASAAELPNASQCDALDAHHHRKWSEAQANHIAENQLIVEHRIQSLTVSHRARCKAIEDQIKRATNDKIRLMKESELARANADFTRHMAELNVAANSGDIRATAVVFGTLTVGRCPV